jgi:hypothetical protein
MKHLAFALLVFPFLTLADCTDDIAANAGGDGGETKINYEVLTGAAAAEAPLPQGPTITYEFLRAEAPPEKPLFYLVVYKQGVLQYKTEFYASTGELNHVSGAGNYEFEYVQRVKFNEVELLKVKQSLMLAAKTSKRMPTVAPVKGDLVEIGGMDFQTGLGLVLEKRSNTDTYVNTSPETFQLTQLIRWLAPPP